MDYNNQNYIKPIQLLACKELDLIFQEFNISNIQIESEIGIGERGVYENKENYLLKLKFSYANSYIFEFYFYYDQLEYYIIKNSKTLGKCNLEDYTDEVNEMVFIFMKYLKKDLIKLNIPFNNLE